MIGLIVSLFATGLSLFIVSRILPSFKIKTFRTALVCAVVLAFVAFGVGLLAPLFVFPLLLLMIPAAVLSGPLAMVVMFLLLLGIKAVLLVITDKLVDDFEIDSWGTAFAASFLMSVVHIGLRIVGLG